MEKLFQSILIKKKKIVPVPEECNHSSFSDAKTCDQIFTFNFRHGGPATLRVVYFWHVCFWPDFNIFHLYEPVGPQRADFFCGSFNLARFWKTSCRSGRRSQKSPSPKQGCNKKAIAWKARGLLRASRSDHGSVGQFSWPFEEGGQLNHHKISPKTFSGYSRKFWKFWLVNHLQRVVGNSTMPKKWKFLKIAQKSSWWIFMTVEFPPPQVTQPRGNSTMPKKWKFLN